MKKCVHCGKENIDKAVYCAGCGAKLDSSSSYSTKFSSNSNSNQAINTTKEKTSSLNMWCCYVPIILFVVFMAAAFIYHDCGESFPVTYGHTYEYFDSDGDGRLSFDEASQLEPSVPDSELIEAFNNADTNNNGYLKGHEYELFYDDIKYYFDDYYSIPEG